jgi:hypothetical protein
MIITGSKFCVLSEWVVPHAPDAIFEGRKVRPRDGARDGPRIRNGSHSHGFCKSGDLPDETIAKKIIELAKMGETNPNRLCEKALVDFRRERS